MEDEWLKLAEFIPLEERLKVLDGYTRSKKTLKNQKLFARLLRKAYNHDPETIRERLFHVAGDLIAQIDRVPRSCEVMKQPCKIGPYLAPRRLQGGMDEPAR